MSTTMTIRVEDEVRDRLERMAEATHRSKSFLASEAVRFYLDINEWQIAETLAGLREADAGDFATAGEVDALMARWTTDAR